MTPVDSWARWMDAQGYTEASVRSYLGGVQRLARGEGDTIPALAVYVGAARAWLAWPDHASDPVTTANAERLVARADEARTAAGSRVLTKRREQNRRRREATSIGPDDWQHLADSVWADESIEGAVLAVLIATGLRIGDALRIERPALTSALSTGLVRVQTKGGGDRRLPWSGAPDEWARLHAALLGHPRDLVTVADVLMGTPHASTLAAQGAYQRVRRALIAHAEAVGLDGRTNLHRLRRTVAVRALSTTEDTVAVQQLLGHASIQTTARYVDEARPQTLAKIQQTINPRKTR